MASCFVRLQRGPGEVPRTGMEHITGAPVQAISGHGGFTLLRE